MRAKTRIFGEVDIQDDKIIRFEQGMIGFPDSHNYTLLFDMEKGDEAAISWLQSLDEPQLAFPVMDVFRICPDYDPLVEDEMLKPLGEFTGDNMFVLVTVSVPSNIEDMAVNLRAPIIINADTKRASQIIVEDDLPVHHKIYELLKAAKEKAGE